jgi:N-terminal acetyltransferase B complex non-catalytic subunit
MALRKTSPKDRNHEFWTILMCYMIHQDKSIPDKERTMFGTLAYRLLSKAAEAVPQDSVRNSLPVFDPEVDFCTSKNY